MSPANASCGVGRAISRSCYACNSKKIRCDKKEPCSSCTRSKHICTFPPMAPRTRRSKKTMMADMAARISYLEQSLVRVTGGEMPNRPSSSTSRSKNQGKVSKSHKSLPPYVQPASESLPEDVMVQKGSSRVYFNEILLSRVIEDEHQVKSMFNMPTAERSSLTRSPFSALGVLSAPSPTTPSCMCHPPKSISLKLWTTYVQQVEGCIGSKLLHLPTDEIKVYSTIDDPIKAPLDSLALCFAIYFASTVSLDPATALSIFQQDKDTQLIDLKLGLEQAFAQGNFLNRPTLTGLQAFAIYLSALRVQNHGKGLWILNGLAMRIAQSLGLHRDGERLGLSPFESEVRRRLWWHLLCRESRSGEDYGLENMNGPSLTLGISLPLNVNDEDLGPEIESLPTAKNGWTPMTFSLVNIDLARAMQRLATAISTSSKTPPSENLRAQIIGETRTQIETRLADCNPVVPQQHLTVLCSRFILRKLDFFTRQQWLALQRPGLREDLATDEVLVEALEIVETRLTSNHDLIKPYAWAQRAFPQYHIIMYILWHLCVRPSGQHVGRAWLAVDKAFSNDLLGDLAEEIGSKSAILAALRSKALSLREEDRTVCLGGIDGPTQSELRTLEEIQSHNTGAPDCILQEGNYSQSDLDCELGAIGMEWPPLTALFQGVQAFDDQSPQRILW